MIRGPVLPHLRERLWAVVSPRLETVERGLELIDESFDCSNGQLGTADGLARDALGAPVLVLLAVEGDVLLTARVLSAIEFLERVGSALAAALPEARLVPSARGRVLVIGTEAAAALLGSLRRVVAARLEVCVLEPFRLAGEERFAVRHVRAADAMGDEDEGGDAGRATVMQVPASHRAQWDALQQICDRLDPEVRVDGERFSRRITWRGHLLAEVVVRAEGLVGSSAGGSEMALAEAGDLRAFSDRILRAYLAARDLSGPSGSSPAALRSERDHKPEREGASPPATAHRAAARSTSGGNNLRSTLAAARLSPEEYSALGGPTGDAGLAGESAGAADDVVRIVAAQESSWPPSAAAD